MLLILLQPGISGRYARGAGQRPSSPKETHHQLECKAFQLPLLPSACLLNKPCVCYEALFDAD